MTVNSCFRVSTETGAFARIRLLEGAELAARKPGGRGALTSERSQEAQEPLFNNHTTAATLPQL